VPFIQIDMSAFSGLTGNYKTYVAAFVGIVGNALAVFHVVTLTPDQLLSANAVVGMVVAIFLRMGVKKAQVAAADATSAANRAATTVAMAANSIPIPKPVSTALPSLAADMTEHAGTKL